MGDLVISCMYKKEIYEKLDEIKKELEEMENAVSLLDQLVSTAVKVGYLVDTYFILSVTENSITGNMLVARENKRCLFTIPENMTEEQAQILLTRLFKESDPDESFVVFTRRDYELALKYKPKDKNISVTLRY